MRKNAKQIGRKNKCKKKFNVSQMERERGVGVEPVAEIPDWMVIRCLSDGSQERGN